MTSERQSADAVRLLLHNTKDVNSKAKDGATVLDWAEKWGDTETLRMLQKAGAIRGAMRPEPASAEPGGAREIRKAVEKSVALMQTSNSVFFRASGCVACHHQMLGGMLVGLARERGVAVNENAASEHLHALIALRAPLRESFLQGQTSGGFPMRDSLVLVALAAQGYPADSLTDAMAHVLMGSQWSDGSWRGFDQRPPLEYSAFSETAYAIRAIQQYAPPGRRPEMLRRVGLAAQWLARMKPIHTEEKVMQLLGLAWAGADPDQIRRAALGLLSDQRRDGGWAQRSGFESDAYATGQALYALRQASSREFAAKLHEIRAA